MARGSGFLSGALFGGAVATGLALLLERRNREQLLEQLAQWRQARENPDEPSGPLGEVVELGAGLLQAGLERLDAALSDAKAVREEERERLTSEWNESIGRQADVSGQVG
jgi:hypothetical protein